MSLDLTKLENIRHLPNGSIEARCPACAEGGHDHTGDHLLVRPDGRFGCCANPDDEQHRKRIFALVGDHTPQRIRVRPAAVAAHGSTIKSGILGRLGRVFSTPSKAPKLPDATDGVNQVGLDNEAFRTLRTGSAKSVQGRCDDSRTLRTPQYSSAYGEELEKRINIQGVRGGASGASGPQEFEFELERGVRGVRMPYLMPDGVLVIPFDSPERYHWWKAGQSVVETMTELRGQVTGPEGKEARS